MLVGEAALGLAVGFVASLIVYAAVIAGLVAWRFKNLAAAVVVGMVALWVLQGIF